MEKNFPSWGSRLKFTRVELERNHYSSWEVMIFKSVHDVLSSADRRLFIFKRLLSSDAVDETIFIRTEDVLLMLLASISPLPVSTLAENNY